METAEQILFESNYGPVLQAVRLYCKSDNITTYSIQDAVQDAFCTAYKRLSQLRNRKAFSAWVTSIAINNIREEYHRQKKHNSITFEDVVHTLSTMKNDIEAIEQKAEIEYLLNSLEDIHREVIILYYLFDLSLNDISDLQKISNATVKSRLHRAREKLRNLYQKETMANEK